MAIKLCIIADDFTGAGDSAVQFRRNGYSVFLGLSDWESESRLSGYDVLVVSTESRFMDGVTAHDTVRDTVRTCRRFGVQRFLKKVDSTIRGNIPEELSAVMEELAYDCAVVATSAPKNNRTVVSGHCLVDGKPIGSGDMDPFTPVHDSYVPLLFQKQFPGAVTAIDLATVRGGEKAFRHELSAVRSNGARVIVADAETIDDLRVIASVQDDSSVLFCGASGLAEALAVGEADSAPALQISPVCAGDVLLVVGSISSTSAGQLRRLRENLPVGVVSLDIAGLLEDEEAELERMLGSARALPKSLPIVVETAERNAHINDVLSAAQKRGLSERVFSGRVSALLGQVTAHIFRERAMKALFVTGGDTAARVSESLGINGIELLTEVLPGVPLGRFEASVAEQPVYFISKAGGFGPPDTFERILQYLSATHEVRKEAVS